MKNQRTIFLIKAGILFAPLVIFLVVYFTCDPFKVLRQYDVYLKSGKSNPVEVNAGYVAVTMFLKNYPKLKYDSFIFGNSRSRFYPVAEWKKYIQATECFHFDASGESLYGIYKKFEFLEKQNIHIKNALIVWDAFLLDQAADSEGHLERQHPLITGESWHSFHVRFLKTFLNGKFLLSYLDFKIRGQVRPYMGKTLSSNIIGYNPVTNELTFDNFENIIAKNREDYYGPQKSQFPPQNPVEQYSDAVIGLKQKEQLRYIKAQLDKNHTIYRIVISPLYYQKKLNARDLKVLNEIFGREFVFDFSGKNEITSTIYNYYESSHYRPHVCRWILSQLYK
jgi:hypothetical protein